MMERGAQFNGTTDVDRTNYFETLPASNSNLEFAIRLEADRMVNSPIKAEDLATEFSVVRNEFEAGENSPERVLSQRMMAVAYEWHNYGKAVIGNRFDIERVTVDNLRAFYKKYYQPDNALLVVAGRFDVNTALQYISRYFGPIPKPDRPLRETYTEEPAQDGERTVTLRRVGDVGIVSLLYHVPPGSHAEFPAVETLEGILGDEPSGRLYQALVATKKAASISVGARAYHDPGALEIVAEVNTRDPKTLEQVRDTMVSEIDHLIQSGVTDEECRRQRQRYLKNRELAAADPNRIAIELSEWAAQGDWRLYFLHRDRFEQVTPKDVKEVAARYLTPRNRTVGFFVPATKPERTPIPQTLNLAALMADYKSRANRSVAAGESSDVTPQAIEARLQRPEPIAGIKLAFLPKKTRAQSVFVRVTLHYGNAENLKGFADAADLLPELMARGTKNLTRQQLKDALDKNFARLGTGNERRMMRALFGGASSGTVSFTLQTRRANLVPALELLRQVLREPTLPAAEFDVLKNEAITVVEQGKADPILQGAISLQRALSRYPADDVRYIPTIEEKTERIENVSLDNVKTLYHDFLGAGCGELVVIGDFDPSELRTVLARTFENWNAQKPYARIEHPYQADIKPAHQTIETHDKENAVYFAGLVLPIRDSDTAYPALLAGNFVLGGGALSSRLANRLRQKGGLSYAVLSIFAADPIDTRADLLVLAIYNPLNRNKVVTGVNEEPTRLLKDGVSQDELEKAKTGYLARLHQLRSDDTLLSLMLTENLFVGRTMQFQADEEQKIDALSPDVVNQMMRQYVDAKQLSIITAGDFKGKKTATKR
jgi:zinc protease